MCTVTMWKCLAFMCALATTAHSDSCCFPTQFECSEGTMTGSADDDGNTALAQVFCVDRTKLQTHTANGRYLKIILRVYTYFKLIKSCYPVDCNKQFHRSSTYHNNKNKIKYVS